MSTREIDLIRIRKNYLPLSVTDKQIEEAIKLLTKVNKKIKIENGNETVIVWETVEQ